MHPAPNSAVKERWKKTRVKNSHLSHYLSTTCKITAYKWRIKLKHGVHTRDRATGKTVIRSCFPHGTRWIENKWCSKEKQTCSDRKSTCFVSLLRCFSQQWCTVFDEVGWLHQIQRIKSSFFGFLFQHTDLFLYLCQITKPYSSAINKYLSFHLINNKPGGN